MLSIHGDLNMEFVTGLQCVFCGATHSTRVPYTCPACGITGMLDVQYDYPAIAKRLNRRTLAKRAEFSHWRYRELLPIRNDAVLPALPVGWTPVVRADSLARHFGLKTLYLKDDGRNPTGSLKDRASSVGVVKAREKRQKIIACASTGNAASSLAGMAASLGLKSVIFVPERAPEPKVTQLLIFGATVLRVRGSYEDAFQMCQGACERWGWYNRNSAINPYLVEGKKTVGLEICEQLAWQVPDWVAVSVGDGCTIAGVWKAFHEMKTLGLIERTPKMLGVQAAGAAPVTTAFRTGEALEAHRAADDCRQHRGGRAAQLEKGSARHSSLRRHDDQCGGRGNSRSHAQHRPLDRHLRRTRRRHRRGRRAPRGRRGNHRTQGRAFSRW